MEGRRASAATLLKYKLGDSAARYALVAQVAYTMRPSVDWDGSKPPERRLDSNGYREFADSWLAISVYRRINQGQFTQDHTEAVIAIHGMEVSVIKGDGGDVWADTRAAVGYPDRQTKQPVEFVRQLLIDNKGKGTVVVGHSLGGCIAQIIASKTGLDAYTFNLPIESKPLDWTWWVRVSLSDSDTGWFKIPQGQLDGMEALG